MGSVANLGKPENCSGPYMGQLTGSPTRCTQSPVTYSYWGCCGYRYYRYRCIQYGINTPDRQSADGELPLNWWSRAHPSASARMAAPDQARTRVCSRRPRGALNWRRMRAIRKAAAATARSRCTSRSQSRSSYRRDRADRYSSRAGGTISGVASLRIKWMHCDRALGTPSRIKMAPCCWTSALHVASFESAPVGSHGVWIIPSGKASPITTSRIRRSGPTEGASRSTIFDNSEPITNA